MSGCCIEGDTINSYKCATDSDGKYGSKNYSCNAQKACTNPFAVWNDYIGLWVFLMICCAPCLALLFGFSVAYSGCILIVVIVIWGAGGFDNMGASAD